MPDLLRPMQTDGLSMLYRTALFAALVASTIAATHQCDWRGQLRIGNSTKLLRLPQSAIWAPPAKPTISDFSSEYTLNNLGTGLPTQISLTPGWDDVAIKLFAFFSTSAALLSPLYWIRRRVIADPALHVISCISVALSFATLPMTLLLLLLGNAGTPILLAASIPCLFIGGIAGFATMPTNVLSRTK